MDIWDKLEGEAITLVYHKLYELFRHHGTVIVLSRLLYWFKPMSNGKSRLKVERNGKKWYRCPRRQIAMDCKLSPKVFRLAQQKLVDAGILEVASWFEDKEKCHNYHINLSALEALLDGKVNCPFGHFIPKVNCPFGHFCKPHLYNVFKTYKKDLHARVKTKQKPSKENSISLPILEEKKEIKKFSLPDLEKGKNKTMPTAQEVLTAFKEKKESKTTITGSQDSLALTWVKEVSGITGNFCPPLTMKEKGMLGRVAKAIGKEKALKALQEALRDWLAFTHRVKVNKGLKTAPAIPTVPYFTTHYATLFTSVSDSFSGSTFQEKTEEEKRLEEELLNSWNEGKKSWPMS